MSLPFIIWFVALLIVQLIFGVVVGWSAHRQQGKSGGRADRELLQLRATLAALQRKKPSPKAAEEKESQLRAGLASLQQLTSGVSKDIQTHASKISAGSLELSNLEQAGQGSPEVDAVAASMLEANAALQERLARAEQKLSEQLEQLRQQSDQARTDALTGLLNRRGFDEEAERCLKEQRQNGEPVSFLMLDIDHFKKFNDQHGHDIGDEVLRETARVASLAVRPVDCVARFGGEELVVIMPGADLEEANRVAECVRIAIAENLVETPEESLEVRVSIGVAQGLREATDALLKRADTALYAAKENGRNRTYYHSGKECLPVLTENQNPADSVGAENPAPEEEVEELESSESEFSESVVEEVPPLEPAVSDTKAEENESAEPIAQTPILSAPEPQAQKPQASFAATEEWQDVPRSSAAENEEPHQPPEQEHTAPQAAPAKADAANSPEPRIQVTPPEPVRRDVLTGLPSHQVLTDETSRCISTGQREGSLLSLMLCDVDGMQAIAQEHGERAAELLTIAMGQFLSSVTGSDELLTRSPTGGFAMLMPGRESDEAAQIARRVQQAVAGAALPLGDIVLRLSLDTGVAHMTPEDDANTLLGRAQQAIVKSSSEYASQTDAPSENVSNTNIPEQAAEAPPPTGIHVEA